MCLVMTLLYFGLSFILFLCSSLRICKGLFVCPAYVSPHLQLNTYTTLFLSEEDTGSLPNFTNLFGFEFIL